MKCVILKVTFKKFITFVLRMNTIKTFNINLPSYKTKFSHMHVPQCMCKGIFFSENVHDRNMFIYINEIY